MSQNDAVLPVELVLRVALTLRHNAPHFQETDNARGRLNGDVLDLHKGSEFFEAIKHVLLKLRLHFSPLLHLLLIVGEQKEVFVPDPFDEPAIPGD